MYKKITTMKTVLLFQSKDELSYAILSKRVVGRRTDYQLRTTGLLEDGTEGTQVAWVNERRIPRVQLTLHFEDNTLPYVGGVGSGFTPAPPAGFANLAR